MNTLINIIKLITAVSALIIELDKTIPTRKAGEQKLGLILETVKDFWNDSRELSKSVTLESLTTYITKFTARFVYVLKAVGLSPSGPVEESSETVEN